MRQAIILTSKRIGIPAHDFLSSDEHMELVNIGKDISTQSLNQSTMVTIYTTCFNTKISYFSLPRSVYVDFIWFSQ
jgi:hypothetical protein